jgi:hypothetical protein
MSNLIQINILLYKKGIFFVTYKAMSTKYNISSLSGSTGSKFIKTYIVMAIQVRPSLTG